MQFAATQSGRMPFRIISPRLRLAALQVAWRGMHPAEQADSSVYQLRANLFRQRHSLSKVLTPLLSTASLLSAAQVPGFRAPRMSSACSLDRPFYPSTWRACGQNLWRFACIARWFSGNSMLYLLSSECSPGQARDGFAAGVSCITLRGV